jgi:hypothetical protein
VTAEPPTVRAGRVTIRPRDDIVVTAPWVAEHRTDAGVAVIDARNPRFYTGEDTNYTRPGHIPGARNLPFDTVVTRAPTCWRCWSREPVHRPPAPRPASFRGGVLVTSASRRRRWVRRRACSAARPSDKRFWLVQWNGIGSPSCPWSDLIPDSPRPY